MNKKSSTQPASCESRIAPSTDSSLFQFDSALALEDIVSPEVGEDLTEPFVEEYPGMDLPPEYQERKASGEYVPDVPDFFNVSNLDIISLGEQPISNLDWLDPSHLETMEADPDSLRPVDYMGRPLPGMDRSLLELQILWSKKTESGATKFRDNYDLRPAPVPVVQYNWPHLERFARTQMELGTSLEAIQATIEQKTGKCAELQKLVLKLEPEQGLAGQVYITANLHPNLMKGDKTAFRSKYATVAYIVADASHPVSQYSKFLGKKVVASVPWEQAVRVYAPYFERTRRRVASGMPAKQAIQQAMLSAPATKVVAATEFPVEPKSKVTFKEAWAALKDCKVERPEEFGKALKTARIKAYKDSLKEEVSRLLSAGTLTEGDLPSKLTFESLHRAAADKMRSDLIKTGSYDQEIVNVSYHSTESSRPEGHDITAHNLRVAEASLDMFVNSGLVQASDAERIRKMPVTKWVDTLKKAASRRAQMKVEHSFVPTVKKVYEGEGTDLYAKYTVTSLTDVADHSKMATAIQERDSNAKMRLASYVTQGKVTSTQMEAIKRRTSSLPTRLKYAEAIALKNSSGPKAIPSSKKAAKYEGEIITSHAGFNGSEQKVARRRVQAKKDVWLEKIRSLMGSGVCGKRLTSMIRQSLPPEVIDELNVDIKDLRLALEGGSGPIEERKANIRKANRELLSPTNEAPAFTDTVNLTTNLEIPDAVSLDALEIEFDFNGIGY